MKSYSFPPSFSSTPAQEQPALTNKFLNRTVLGWALPTLRKDQLFRLLFSQQDGGATSEEMSNRYLREIMSCYVRFNTYNKITSWDITFSYRQIC